MTATTPATVPGVYDIPAETYHADPVPGGSLSSTGARRILPPGCPARYRWEADHGTLPKPAWDLGTAAHRLVLGTGPELVRIDAAEWRSRKVKQQVAAVRAAGDIPLRPADYDQVRAMAAALRSHRIAAALLDPDRGDPEQTLIWRDLVTGVWRRAMLDWLRHPGGGRFIVGDYKTCRSADPDAIQRAVHTYGYHCQGAWYLDGITALGLDPAPAFVLICQEKEPPYLVTVAEIDATALRIGRALNRQAIEIYAECTATGRWPGYSDDIELIRLPAWLENRFLLEAS
ncbi:PD-(D/E)XK nuclease-like domain-containing protein [Spongiactinospora sp. TRM90649]|uniref:PD-(D/E)XK nuclease-like domain-containing protein n=1 Tax=Spongiactinospora sp. TRM90649 TaxID=3031114 RepID=UPI0023F9F831|nr:PD-(D/E)XK nuclease-like domain-containing protein [Spongiactinospora sp. TRM90649]MDF5755790.1 PD-(D/E)XK nuclease-like domain-containing protein [Spongiactinospora sp. TRM90649]